MKGCILFLDCIVVCCCWPAARVLSASEQVFVLDKFLREYAGLNAEQIDSDSPWESRRHRPRFAHAGRGLRVWHGLC